MEKGLQEGKQAETEGGVIEVLKVWIPSAPGSEEQSKQWRVNVLHPERLQYKLKRRRQTDLQFVEVTVE